VGAEHTIYVPTADVLGNPSQAAFYAYTPAVTVDNNDDADIIADEAIAALVEVEQ